MNYCVQETWVVRNTVIMVHGHMIFLHKRCEREEGTKGRKYGYVAIILDPTTVVAWEEAGSNPPINTPFDSKFVGRFVEIKMSYPNLIKEEK